MQIPISELEKAVLKHAVSEMQRIRKECSNTLQHLANQVHGYIDLAPSSAKAYLLRITQPSYFACNTIHEKDAFRIEKILAGLDITKSVDRSLLCALRNINARINNQPTADQLLESLLNEASQYVTQPDFRNIARDFGWPENDIDDWVARISRGRLPADGSEGYNCLGLIFEYVGFPKRSYAMLAKLRELSTSFDTRQSSFIPPDIWKNDREAYV